jgi:hypothetical protein
LSDDDSVVGGPAQLTRQVEISEPKFGFGLAIVLGESRGRAKPCREYCFSNGLAKDPGTRWFG